MKNRFTLFVFFLGLSSFVRSQTNNGNCQLNGKDIGYPDATFFGQCSNQKANGIGKLTFSSGISVTGKFVNNQLQNQQVEYYFPRDKSTCFSGNIGLNIHGNVITTDPSGHVYYSTYANGKQVCIGGLKNLKLPEIIDSSVFSDSYANKVMNGYQIPGTTKIIYFSSKENHSMPYYNYWLTIFDIRKNEIIQQFGSLVKPLYKDSWDPKFLGFYKGNPVLNINSKIVEYNNELNQLDFLTEIPKELIAKEQTWGKLVSKVKSGYRYGNCSILSNGSIITYYNHELLDFMCFRSNDQHIGTGGGIQVLDSNFTIKKEISFEKNSIFNVREHEESGKLAVSMKNLDSTYLVVYDLKDLRKIYTCFAYSNSEFESGSEWYEKNPGNLRFSQSGEYLFHTIRNDDTQVYKDGKLYFAFKGNPIYELDGGSLFIAWDDGNEIWLIDVKNKEIKWELDFYGNTDFHELNDFGISNLHIVDDVLYIVNRKNQLIQIKLKD